ncbi:MAG: phage Gp37/Gp68 family protein, partial [Muribaculaceae bacterium]|nr:phage Gp37/Gp68 family protein [Muribaculaceae bacterium]
MTAPLIGQIEIDKFLRSGQIEQVIAGGENYDGARPCNFDWVKSLSAQCHKHDVSFY